MNNKYKETKKIIKKQINSNIILEDICQFIGENIAYHKEKWKIIIIMIIILIMMK